MNKSIAAEPITASSTGNEPTSSQMAPDQTSKVKLGDSMSPWIKAPKVKLGDSMSPWPAAPKVKLGDSMMPW